MSPDLLSLVFKLKNPRPVSMPYDQGRALSAEFLSWVQSFDAKLSAALHDPNNVPRPYTVSNLNDLPKPNRGMVYLPSGTDTWFRITSVALGLTDFLVEQLSYTVPDEIVISDSKFEIEWRSFDPARHPWAGWTTYQDLINHDLIKKVYPKIRYEFSSPTSFHNHGQHFPFVTPEMAIPSWFKSWNAYAPVTFLDEVLESLKSSVAISHYKMLTAPVRYGQATIVGGLGTCTFNILSKDEYLRHVVNALSAFAFYCGTGVKTALGMGQTRRLGDDYYRNGEEK